VEEEGDAARRRGFSNRGVHRFDGVRARSESSAPPSADDHDDNHKDNHNHDANHDNHDNHDAPTAASR
jgi:hypothetical protein